MKNQVRMCDQCSARADTQGGFKRCERCRKTLCPQCQRGRSQCDRCPGAMEYVGAYYE